MTDNTPKDDSFLDAAKGQDRGLIAEFVAFLGENKLWWMTPILVVLGLVGVLIVGGAVYGGVMPFLYSFF